MRRKKSRFFGLNKQDIIKYYFGGNAAAAIIALVLICWFLLSQAFFFFPNYRNSLQLYRESGQEYVDFSDDRLQAQVKISSLMSQVSGYELRERIGVDADSYAIYVNFRGLLAKKVKFELKDYARAREKEGIMEFLGEEEQNQIRQSIEATKQSLENAAKTAAAAIEFSDIEDKSLQYAPEKLEFFRQAAVEGVILGETPESVKAIQSAVDTKKQKLLGELPVFVKLAEAQDVIKAPQAAFRDFITQQRKYALETKARGVAFKSAAEEKASLDERAKSATSEEEKKRLAIKSARYLTQEPDYAKLNAPLYESKAQQAALAVDLLVATEKSVSMLPDPSELTSVGAKKRLGDIKKGFEEVEEIFANKGNEASTWDHTKHYSMSEAVVGFFFGTKWVTNSSWQDFYGVVPLFLGSFGAALVAVVLAVPFAVGGAIYVNRLSSPLEQQVIKPVIEFIQAIPSVVLAFFGVIVLGSFLFKYGQNPALAWIPGFPIEGKLTMLNAGVLLALMAVPTIFTLAEDALNNVPKSYQEASLALGATKLQTVLKVILPSCFSGVIAAVLLGFGRIVGETMVVLLVMGGRIAIPTSFTDPAHSMTGLLAQEIGEVDKGSLHWGALFMVGLVLFTVSLSLNWLAQTILRRLAKHK